MADEKQTSAPVRGAANLCERYLFESPNTPQTFQEKVVAGDQYQPGSEVTKLAGAIEVVLNVRSRQSMLTRLYSWSRSTRPACSGVRGLADQELRRAPGCSGAEHPVSVRARSGVRPGHARQLPQFVR